jgi:FdhD protein
VAGPGPTRERTGTLPRVARGRTAKVLTTRWDGAGAHRAPDELIVEEPMEIRLDGRPVTTTMRTPGHDFELAVGLCHAEGLLDEAPVRACRYCATGAAAGTGFNVVSVDTGGRAALPRAHLTRATSSCGVCGTADLDALTERLRPRALPWPVGLDLLASVPGAVGAEQTLFELTGAVHAAAAFDATGRPLVVREDVGRHNAVDKVVGRLLLDGRLPADDLGLYVSGRASFEMVQKAWAAGFGAVVAVSAPSSLAVQTAVRAGIVLAGFARDGRLNLYAGEGLDPHAVGGV